MKDAALAYEADGRTGGNGGHDARRAHRRRRVQLAAAVSAVRLALDAMQADGLENGR